MRRMIFILIFFFSACSGIVQSPTVNLGPLVAVPDHFESLQVGIPVSISVTGGNGLYEWRFETGGPFTHKGNEATFIPMKSFV